MAINKINLDGTEYDVGKKLYKHDISIDFLKETIEECTTFYCEIINESNTPITQQQFVDYINNYNYQPFSQNTINGVAKENVLSCAIINNYYGASNFAFQAIIFTEKIEQFSVDLGNVFGNYIERFTDKVASFITEV